MLSQLSRTRNSTPQDGSDDSQSSSLHPHSRLWVSILSKLLVILSTPNPEMYPLTFFLSLVRFITMGISFIFTIFRYYAVPCFVLVLRQVSH